MRLRIEGHDLPGRTCGPSPDAPDGYANVHVGVQRRGRPSELLDLQPGDAASVVWTLDVSVSASVSGADLRGPYVQGGPGERFVYLSWGAVDESGGFRLFRRAKLMLADVDPAVLAAAQRSGTLVARLGLTDGRGHPTCARIRPPVVEWAAR
jgi:hypothetical protein